jgi:hypothetical protein
MIYNTRREAINMREYGRHMQRFVEHIKQLPKKEERQAAAEQVIEMMAILNPQNKTTVDYKQKLWDHLHIMSNFELDIDSPYPMPAPEEAHIKPSFIPYPKSKIRMRHYGKNVEAMVQRAVELDDPEKKEALVQIIANFMKLAYKNWSNEEVSNDLIREDLRTLSKGQLSVSDDMHIEVKVAANAPGSSQGQNRNKKGKGKFKPGSNRNQGPNKKRFRNG